MSAQSIASVDLPAASSLLSVTPVDSLVSDTFPSEVWFLVSLCAILLPHYWADILIFLRISGGKRYSLANRHSAVGLG